jgi:uncharacterized membrane protein YhhN
MKSEIILKSYIGFSIIYLLVLLSGRDDIAQFMKPILLPILIVSVRCFSKFSTSKILLFALMCSWIGDVILLFVYKGEIYFILGLIAFLISHVAYIYLFSKQEKRDKNKSNTLLYIGYLLVFVYFVVLLTILLPKLGGLKIPVIVYAIVITTMLLFALKESQRWVSSGNKYILVGAIVFVSSDSILAIDKFYSPINQATFFIMATYIIAQYLIVTGIFKLNKKALNK